MEKTPPADSSGEARTKAVEGERQNRIEAAFLEGLRRRMPEHAGVLESLGCLYTEMGRYEEGLDADREMVRLQPHSPLAWYNLACSLSLTGQADAAFAALGKAVDRGYSDADWMQGDKDFDSIRSDPRFAMLLAQVQARSALA